RGGGMQPARADRNADRFPSSARYRLAITRQRFGSRISFRLSRLRTDFLAPEGRAVRRVSRGGHETTNILRDAMLRMAPRMRRYARRPLNPHKACGACQH